MPPLSITRSEQELLVQEYTIELDILSLSELNTKSIRTKPFSPVSNIDVMFCFDVYYQMFQAFNKFWSEISRFKLELVKLRGLNIPSSMKLKVQVVVNYSDGTVFKEYRNIPPLDVLEFDVLNFEGVVSQFYSKSVDDDYHCTPHSVKMASDSLSIRCHLLFYNHLNLPASYIKDLNSLRTLRTYANDFRILRNSKVLNDVTFIVESKQLFAHQAILAAHSPVFERMLTQDFLENKSNQVIINDSSYSAFEIFLTYLYSGEIQDMAWPNLKELYILSDKYDVPSLRKECALNISYNISVETVSDILTFASNFSDDDLKNAAKKYAVYHMRELVFKEEWKEFVQLNPLISYEVTLDFISNVDFKHSTTTSRYF